MADNYKTVCKPIVVPKGDYCWFVGKNPSDRAICEYFDNEGGHSTCGMDFWQQKDDRNGCKKDPKCAALTTI